MLHRIPTGRSVGGFSAEQESDRRVAGLRSFLKYLIGDSLVSVSLVGGGNFHQSKMSENFPELRKNP